MKSGRILFVDDDATLRKVLARELAAFGLEVSMHADASSALQQLQSFMPDVALIDLRLPGMDGMALLARLLERLPDLPIVMLTGHGSVPEAVEAMRRGAYDFLTKPVSLDTLEQTLRRALERGGLLAENRRLRELVVQNGPTEILGTSPASVELRSLVRRVAQSEANVLITGENGTGKELVARALHSGSSRSAHPFVVIHCGAIPDELVESELFGHEKGSFTGAERKRVGLLEAAHQGTVFLDEIGELPPMVQPTLLRAIQFGEIRPVGSSSTLRVDVRVIAATNRELLAEVEAGRFREDLYYRLATLVLEVPPLRDRGGDIELLARYFLEKQNALRPKEKHQELTAEAVARLSAHEWPGNVRELENTILRVAMLVDERRIRAEHVDQHLISRRRRTSAVLPTFDVQELERLAVVESLRKHRGNRKAAAAELGVAVKTLYNKIQAYDVKEQEFLGVPPSEAG